MRVPVAVRRLKNCYTPFTYQYTADTSPAARVESSGADARICVRGSPLFLSPLLFPTEVGSPLNQLGGLVERGKLPCRVRPKTNLVHSEVVRKLLAAIILSILKCMFYSRTIKI